MNVPKPPRGMPGVTFFGHCYKWRDVFYKMGEEYTINKADFNPAIMVDLSPPKKKVEKVEEVTEVELNTSDEVPTEAVVGLSKKFEADAKERKHRNK